MSDVGLTERLGMLEVIEIRQGRPSRTCDQTLRLTEIDHLHKDRIALIPVRRPGSYAWTNQALHRQPVRSCAWSDRHALP